MSVSDSPAVSSSADRRRVRRSLSAEQLRHLLAVTRQSDRIIWGLSGEDRFVLDSVAMVTGFRAGELGSLLPEWFSLNTEPFPLTLPAREDKARRAVTQPLPLDVTEVLRDYLKARHSDPKLTMAVDGRAQLVALAQQDTAFVDVVAACFVSQEHYSRRWFGTGSRRLVVSRAARSLVGCPLSLLYNSGWRHEIPLQIVAEGTLMPDLNPDECQACLIEAGWTAKESRIGRSEKAWLIIAQREDQCLAVSAMDRTVAWREACRQAEVRSGPLSRGPSRTGTAHAG